MNRADNRRGFRLAFNSPAVLGFAGVCLVAMVLNLLTDGASNRALFSVYRAPLTNPLTWLRMVCHVFGHADWNHLLNNMMYVLLVGPMLEEKYGSVNLILVMLATALLTGLANFIFFPGTMLLGASGIVFALILLSSITRTEGGAIPVTFILVAILYIGQQVWQAITVRDNVSYMAHIAGGAVGAGLGFLLNKAGKGRG
jgi:GlpG protein